MRSPELEITVTDDWTGLVASDPRAAIAEQARLKKEFEAALNGGLVAVGFSRGDTPKYLLHKS